jgi:acyl carrier protein
MQNANDLEITRNQPVFSDAASDGPYSAAAITSWLISEIEELLSIEPGHLVVDKPLLNYGLSSMTGMILSGNIEERLGIQLDPSVAWEYPTIESLAVYLAGEVKSQHLSLSV